MYQAMARIGMLYKIEERIRGAQASAMVYSITETAMLNKKVRNSPSPGKYQEISYFVKVQMVTYLQIDCCASGKIKHSLSKPAGVKPSAGPGSPRQLRSGYFPGGGWLQENSLRRHRIAAPVLKEALRTPDPNCFRFVWPFPECCGSNSLG